MPKKRSRRRRLPGRKQVPPPALMGTGEPFEGFHLLAEGPGAQATVLWQSLRDVLLWAGVSTEARRTLFAEGAEQHRLALLLDPEIDGALRAPLVTLAGVLRAESEVTREDVAAACGRISRRAEEHGMPQTAVSFAQAAAVVVPESAAHAYRVGLLCRHNAEYVRAETWFRRAIGLARNRDPEAYALAHVGLAHLCQIRGSYRIAQTLHLRALRAARRKGLKDVTVMALHNLFSIAVEQVQVVAAEHLAREAFRAYPPDHPRLPALAHDVASFWMLQGRFERALAVFHAVYRLIHRPAERLLVLSNVARAAGGAGQPFVFLDAWLEAWRIIDHAPGTERVCSAALNLAYGSMSLSDWERAELAAQYALDRAVKRGETGVESEARAILKSVRAREPAQPQLPAPEDPEIVRSAEALAEEMVRELTACAGEPIEKSPPRTLWER